MGNLQKIIHKYWNNGGKKYGGKYRKNYAKL